MVAERPPVCGVTVGLTVAATHLSFAPHTALRQLLLRAEPPGRR